MPLAGIVTLVGVALTVAALAFYLIRIAVYLQHVSFTLGTIIAAVNAIGAQSEPLHPVMGDVNSGLANTQAGLQEVLDRANARQRRAAGGPAPAAGKQMPSKKASAAGKTAGKKATKKQAKKGRGSR